MLTSSGRAQRGAEHAVVLVELVQRLLEAGAGQCALVLRDAGGVKLSWSIASLTRGFFRLSGDTPPGGHPVTDSPGQAGSG